MINTEITTVTKLVVFDREKDERSCAVVALMNAFDIDYATASEFLAVMCGRKKNRGTPTAALIHTLDQYCQTTMFGKYVQRVITHQMYSQGQYFQPVKRQMKLTSFIKKYSKGTYYVLVRGHALVVKDGLVLNTYLNTKNQPVKWAWKVGE